MTRVPTSWRIISRAVAREGARAGSARGEGSVAVGARRSRAPAAWRTSPIAASSASTAVWSGAPAWWLSTFISRGTCEPSAVLTSPTGPECCMVATGF
eukprot:4648490-Prymnesium_polylepis.1